jgi:hypothetical protein
MDFLKRYGPLVGSFILGVQAVLTQFGQTEAAAALSAAYVAVPAAVLALVGVVRKVRNVFREGSGF